MRTRLQAPTCDYKALRLFASVTWHDASDSSARRGLTVTTSADQEDPARWDLRVESPQRMLISQLREPLRDVQLALATLAHARIVGDTEDGEGRSERRLSGSALSRLT